MEIINKPLLGYSVPNEQNNHILAIFDFSQAEDKKRNNIKSLQEGKTIGTYLRFQSRISMVSVQSLVWSESA